MEIILDADVIIGGEKANFDLAGWLRSHENDQFAIAAITVAELWHGVERASGSRKSRRRQFLEIFLDAVPILPYTEQTAREHARIWAQLESAGTMIGAYNLVVAATAFERRSSVATFNKKHFSQIKGLNVIDPK